jgi:hypothetical protein
LALLLGLLCVGPAAAESARYQVAWNGIPAAALRIDVREDQADHSIRRMEVEMATNAVVDFFWTFRARGWSELGPRARPARFGFEREVRGRAEHTVVEYAPGLLVGRYRRPDRYRVTELAAVDAVDPLAMLVRLRGSLPSPGHPESFHVFTGEARYRFVVRHGGVETISVPAGTFEAVRVSPYIWRLDRDERDDRIDSMTLWFGAKAPHRLLRMRSELFVGAVSCDLAELRSAPEVNADL